MSKGRKRGNDDDPKMIGLAYREGMDEQFESVVVSVWRHIMRVYEVDLKDPDQADDMFLYRLIYRWKARVERDAGVGCWPWPQHWEELNRRFERLKG